MADTKTKLFLAGVIIIVAVSYNRLLPKDDTDPEDGRSNLVLYTDHKTGCQYLKAGSIFGGALTPRLDGTGKPMCGRKPA